MALPGWSAGQIQGRLSVETILLNLLACVLREYKLVDKLQIQIPLIAEQSEVLVLVTKEIKLLYQRGIQFWFDL